ncbi:MAG: hypothetical protein KJ737_22535 [Proteobacteria bacterium]|nr:hypothetical protein [Pseudomonadota bacterium]
MKQFNKKKLKKMLMGTVLSASIGMTGLSPALANHFCKPATDWLAGDFHQHTLYTDGSTSFGFVMDKNNEFGLDWWANSEHGGKRNRDGEGVSWKDTTKYPENPILGDNPDSGYMYRWQSLRDFVYPDILSARSLFPEKQIFSGVEWNVPAHEHCSVSIVSDTMGPLAVSAFEYQFDKSDDDTSRTGEWTPFGVLSKHNSTHEDSVAACAWMQEQYENGLIDNAWIIWAHIERAEAYQIEHFRDFNNAAPDICFGFEGAPGHQVNSKRGFGRNPGEAYGGAYGGVGSFTAQVGGLWDALLGEGRHWFNYASSDYHKHYTAGGDDFYPGEYQKTYVQAKDSDRDGEYSLNEIADGLRSGNAYFVHGDLVNHLDFNAASTFGVAAMGNDLHIKDRRHRNEPLVLTIRFKSPEANNNNDVPVVDHIDLIAGNITGKIDPDSPDYTKATNETTKVMKTFTAEDWETDRDGYNVIKYRIKDMDSSMYFRLRGTNLAVNTPHETDAHGNPVSDFEATDYLGLDGADEAWADLWFYSNPIFVYVD